MINVIMISKKDFAGSGQQICNAVKSYNINAKLIVKEKSNFGANYDYDLKNTNKAFLQSLIDKADIIHFKGDDLPTNQFYGLQINKFKPKIITVGGSNFRRGSVASVSHGKYDIQTYVERTLFRSCLTPDLNYKDFKGYFIPHAIESENKEITYKLTKKFKIVHSPSNRHKKGTNDIVIPAFEYLQNKYKNVECVLIENVSNEKCIEFKKTANVFIDQFFCGWYGMNAIECMQYGIPVICYISDEALQQAGELPELPIINCKPDKDSLINILEELKNKNLNKISKQTKIFCDNFHSYTVVGKQWADIYENIYANNINNINVSKQNKDLSIHYDLLPEIVNLKVINNIYRGLKLSYKINENIKVKKQIAISYLQKGIAELIIN